jgi:hypothetical protein
MESFLAEAMGCYVIEPDNNHVCQGQGLQTQGPLQEQQGASPGHQGHAPALLAHMYLKNVIAH